MALTLAANLGLVDDDVHIDTAIPMARGMVATFSKLVLALQKDTDTRRREIAEAVQAAGPRASGAGILHLAAAMTRAAYTREHFGAEQEQVEEQDDA